jgi:hypothetical protein
MASPAILAKYKLLTMCGSEKLRIAYTLNIFDFVLGCRSSGGSDPEVVWLKNVGAIK